jgi:hypothetical protein
MMYVLRSGLLLALVFAAVASRAAGPDNPYRDDLLVTARALNLSADRKWHRLLHYRPHGKGWRSEADGLEFFLSPIGKYDPDAELEATLKAFFEPMPADPKGQHPQCRFPARYAWLKARLGFDPARLPERSCADFEAWRNAIDAGSVSLVFADAFLGNPASMYGHTFLRFQRKGGGGDPLLDYTINFAASPTTDNPILYMLEGFDGAFPGEYSLMPFYMKTAEYTDLENRDLWDYPLNLTQAQIDFLLMHGWEMGSTHFNYYFLSKNCSYQLLTFLEAGDDALDVSAKFRSVVIPADTVRALLAQPGLVGPVRYRPSFVSEIKARRSRLNWADIPLASALGRRPDSAHLAALEGYSKERQALILESAADYLRYRSGFGQSESTETLTGEHALLVARGRLGVTTPPAQTKAPKPLEDGHDSARLSVGFGASRTSSFQELAWHRSLQDLPADDAGYVRNSQLLWGDVRLRFDDERRQSYIEKLDVLSIISLTPWDPWVLKPSWKLSTGVDQAKELGCYGADCMYYNLNGGMGLAAESSLWRRELYYLMAEADFGAGPVFADGWRGGGGGTAGIKIELASYWRLLLEATYIAYGESPSRERIKLIQSWRLSRDIEIRATLDRLAPYEEAGLTFHYYY